MIGFIHVNHEFWFAPTATKFTHNCWAAFTFGWLITCKCYAVTNPLNSFVLQEHKNIILLLLKKTELDAEAIRCLDC
jgi:hypothetical protein